MPTLVGFNTFAALPEEEISGKISRLSQRFGHIAAPSQS
jgi:hypothetical protein